MSTRASQALSSEALSSDRGLGAALHAGLFVREWEKVLAFSYREFLGVKRCPT